MRGNVCRPPRTFVFSSLYTSYASACVIYIYLCIYVHHELYKCIHQVQQQGVIKLNLLLYIHIYLHKYIHQPYIYIYIYINIYINILIYTYVYTYIRTYIHIACVYIYVCIQKYNTPQNNRSQDLWFSKSLVLVHEASSYYCMWP